MTMTYLSKVVCEGKEDNLVDLTNSEPKEKLTGLVKRGRVQ